MIRPQPLRTIGRDASRARRKHANRATLDHLTNAVVARVQQRNFDGVLFAIHGAMVAETIDEADAYILQRLRDAIGRDIPLDQMFA